MLHLGSLNVYKQPQLLYCSNLPLKAIRSNILSEEQKEKFVQDQTTTLRKTVMLDKNVTF